MCRAVGPPHGLSRPWGGWTAPGRPAAGTSHPGSGSGHYRRGMRMIPVASAAYVAPVLAGPGRAVVVSAVFSGAVVLDVKDGEHSAGTTVVLLDPRATAVPLGVRGTAPLPMVPVGAQGRVGDGGVDLAGTAFRLARTWSSSVPVIDPAADRLAELTGRARQSPLGLDHRRLANLAGALRDNDQKGVADGVRSLVGLGIGSTPAGDDVLAGLMVALHVRGRADLAASVSAAIDPTRTTSYSAALLVAAAAGHAALEALAVLRWLHRPTAADPAPEHADPLKINASGRSAQFSSHSGPHTMIMGSHPIDRLLAVGHTSGADLTAGLLLGLRVDRAQLDPAGTEAA